MRAKYEPLRPARNDSIAIMQPTAPPIAIDAGQASQAFQPCVTCRMVEV